MTVVQLLPKTLQVLWNVWVNRTFGEGDCLVGVGIQQRDDELSPRLNGNSLENFVPASDHLLPVRNCR